MVNEKIIELIKKPNTFVALVVRVSSDDFKQSNSLEYQEKSLIDFCNEYKVSNYKLYIDHISGKKTEKRKQFQEMLKSCENEEISLVITLKRDRFIRNANDSKILVDKFLREYHIPIYCIEDGFIKDFKASEKFMNNVRSDVDQHYSDVTRDNVFKQWQHKLDKGEWIGRIPYGYKDKNKNRLIHHKGRSKKKPAKLVIDENKSKNVVLIYNMIKQKKSLSNISKTLNLNKNTVKQIINNINKKTYHGYRSFKWVVQDELGLEHEEVKLYKGLHPPILHEG